MCERPILTLLLTATAFVGSAAAQNPTPFPLELALGIRSPARGDRPALSSDGQHVAYTIAHDAPPDSDSQPEQAAAPAQFRGLRLHVVDTTNGQVVWVSNATASAWAASWSPDGSTVAFYCDEGREVGLWSYRAGDAAARRLGKSVIGAFHHMRPEWTPDGAAILVPTIAPVAMRDADPASTASADPEPPTAAAGNPGIVVRRTGGELTATTAAALSSAATPDPPPQAAQSLVAAPPATLSAVLATDGSVTAILPAGDRPEFVAARISPSGHVIACERSLRAVFEGGLQVLIDVALVRRTDGVTIHRVEGLALDPNIDPSSPTLAAMAWHPTEDRFAYLHAGKLMLVDATVTPPRQREVPLAANGAHADRVQFTADGSTLLVSMPATDAPAEDPFLARVLAIPVGAGPPRELLPPAGVKLRGVLAANWRTAWQPATDALVAAATETNSGTPVFVRMPLHGEPATVVHRAAGNLRVVAALARGRALALVESHDTAPDYFLLDADFTPLQRLSRAEPRLASVAIGPVDSFTTEIEAGGARRTVHAVVALPPGSKRGDRLPTIVTCYPGQEQSRLARGFGGGDVTSIPAAVFTTRGYAVLVLDVPLAPFGVPSQPLRDIQDAVLAQVRHAVELGYTDGDRVGVIGHSYGGYGAACLACGPPAFRAAVAISGSYDLAGVYATGGSDESDAPGPTMNMLLLEQHQGRMGRPLWDDPQRYLDNSPYFQADKIHTPMLLLHGLTDTNCPPGEAEKLFNALKRLGRTAQLALYAGEGHVPEEWSRANRLDLTTRTLAFFDRHLRGGQDTRR